MTRYEPFRELARLQGEVSRPFDDRPLFRAGESVGLSPSAISGDANGPARRRDLAGDDSKGVDARLESGVLTVRGERRLEDADHRARVS